MLGVCLRIGNLLFWAQILGQMSKEEVLYGR